MRVSQLAAIIEGPNQRPCICFIRSTKQFSAGAAALLLNRHDHERARVTPNQWSFISDTAELLRYFERSLLIGFSAAIRPQAPAFLVVIDRVGATGDL
jgi:hypothetical protein